MKTIKVILITFVLVIVQVTQSYAEFKLTASDAAAGDMFGNAVAISGDYAIVGAYGNDDAGNSSGSAYIFVRSGETWIEQAKLTASDAAAGDMFGNAVAISGDYAIVGAYGNDDAGNSSGSAYIFVRSGETWIEQAKLTASDAAAGDMFGNAVAISSDYAIVGAYFNDNASGSAYTFVRNGETWSEQTKLTASDAAEWDMFGYSVAISGDYAIVGAYGNDDTGESSGSAYIFVRHGSSWIEQTKLIASDAAAGDVFGNSIAISGDYVIVGAYGNDDAGSNSGSVYIFVRSGETWIEQAKLTASDAAAGDIFGNSVAIIISGDYAIVGAYFNDAASGSAYIFVRHDSSWIEQTKLTAGDAAAGDMFGRSVAISGDYVIVGAYGNDDAGSSSGSAYIYVNPTTTTVKATIDIDPDTLNLKSGGKWITCYIELPDGYNVEDIDVNTVMLEDSISAEPKPTEVGDYDGDDISDLMVKFDRQALIEALDGATGSVELTVTGELNDSSFEGIYIITVISNEGQGKPVPAPLIFSLRQNFRNPFNPDTFIPYTLANDVDVVIHIYNSLGQLVRTLNLGHQPAGYYTSKAKAAYWDGKDSFGEKVASGVYFYTLWAGKFSATRKMVVMK